MCFAEGRAGEKEEGERDRRIERNREWNGRNYFAHLEEPFNTNLLYCWTKRTDSISIFLSLGFFWPQKQKCCLIIIMLIGASRSIWDRTVSFLSRQSTEKQWIRSSPQRQKPHKK